PDQIKDAYFPQRFFSSAGGHLVPGVHLNGFPVEQRVYLNVAPEVMVDVILPSAQHVFQVNRPNAGSRAGTAVVRLYGHQVISSLWAFVRGDSICVLFDGTYS